MWLLFALLPTYITYKKLTSAKIIKSRLLAFSMSWFIGQFISLLIILGATSIFSSGSPNTFSYIIHLFLAALFGLILLKFPPKKFKSQRYLNLKHINKLITLKNTILLLLLIFSIKLYAPHLTIINNIIYTSPAFWDFNIHFPIIQNFVHGNNFPPQNESFANIPMTYHFFLDFLTSIYASLGLDLIGSINFVSIIMFFTMLIAIIGISEEFFRKSAIGYIAVALTLTSSSLHFIYIIFNNTQLNFLELLDKIYTNTAHPYFFSFIKNNPFGYNGTMFNIFYFISERQMVFGILFMITSLAFIYYRDKLKPLTLFILGCFMGQFFEGHLFIAISIGAALGFLLVFDKNKKQTLFLLAGFTLLFLFHVLYAKHLMQPEYFYSSINDYPALNFNFPTITNYPLSPTNALKYYLFAYGLKPIFLIIGLWLIIKKDKRVFWTLLAIIFPTFILTNTTQLSPLSIYDNHKWIRPMNIIVDIATAFGIYYIFFQHKKIKMYLLGFLIILLLTFSGIIELMPFLNSKPTRPYALYPSPLINDIRQKTNPNAVFASNTSKEIHLSGRKLYLGSSIDEPGAISLIDTGLVNKKSRKQIINSIYKSKSSEELCSLTTANQIDYVVLNPDDQGKPIESIAYFFPKLVTTNEIGKTITLLDINKGCWRK